MVVLRLAGAFVLITIAASVALYLFTRNRRYLVFAWRVFQFALVLVTAVLVLFVLERMVLVI
jgi:hypothetical protein